MFGFFEREEDETLDKPIAMILEEMTAYGPSEPEFTNQIDNLERMMALKDMNKSKRRPNPDTVLLVGGNFAIAAFLVIYEQKHVLTTKALGFLLNKKSL